MPFGLVSAPAVFQALISDVLCDMLNKFVFVFFLIIFSFPLIDIKSMSNMPDSSCLIC